MTAALGVDACARALQRPIEQPAPRILAQLWRDPVDLENRDLYLGPDSSAIAPQPVPYSFLEHKRSGTNPGYEVRDPAGRRWSVKLGDEAQSEVTASRVLWAVGFHQPPVYYVEAWTMIGPEGGPQPGGRFRAELPAHEVIGEWSWYENPFIGSRPFAALVAINLLLNNWDLKTSNNKVYRVPIEDGGSELRYVVRDLGGSLGKARQPRFLRWLPFMRYQQGSTNTLDDFEAQGFITRAHGEQFDFEYRGIDGALVHVITLEDLRWTCALLSRLSERQWSDAFRAGGYTGDQGARYVRKIRQKIAEAERVAKL
jgi:hypothetical protein